MNKIIKNRNFLQYTIMTFGLSGLLTSIGAYVERDTNANIKYKKIFFENTIYGIFPPFSIVFPCFFVDKLKIIANDHTPIMKMIHNYYCNNFGLNKIKDSNETKKEKPFELPPV